MSKKLIITILRLAEVCRANRIKHHTDYDLDVAVKRDVDRVLNTYIGLNNNDLIDRLEAEIEYYEKSISEGR